MLFRKGISPVVATALLIVVAVVALTGFQNWFNTYSSSVFVDVEKKSSLDEQTRVEALVGDTLYIYSGRDNLSINKVSIGGVDCVIEGNLSKGINNISVYDCLQSVDVNTPDIVLVTDNDVVVKKVILKDAASGYLINFLSPTPSNGAVINLNNFEILASISGGGLNSVIYQFDGGNHTIYNDSLVLMMNFDNREILGENNSFVKDLSLSGNDGVVGVNTTFVADGRYSGAFEFTGVTSDASYIHLGNDSSLRLSDEFAVSLWVKRGSNSDWRPVMTKDNNGHEYWFGFHSNRPIASLVNINAVRSDMYGDIVISDSQWHFVAYTYDGSDVRIYVDGVIDRTHAFPFAVRTGTSDVTIGKTLTWNYVFNGVIDELRVWNRVLSSDDIEFMYNSNLNKYNNNLWYFYMNETNLNEGVYNYQGFFYDSSDVLYSSQLRSVEYSN